MNAKGVSLKKRIFKVIQIGNKSDLPSRLFDVFIVIMIFLNMSALLFGTFNESAPYTGVIDAIELVTVIVFSIEYALRIWTAEYLYPDKNRAAAIVTFIFSFYGLIDLLTILPFYLPFVFPAGAVAFRMLRVIRIFRLFKINTQYDAFNIITNVIKEKRSQLLSTLCLILIMMIASSLSMYTMENEAQPEAFENAFSGIWWSASTLLTVGYGDIYPITAGGKVMAMLISFLGVGMVAIPTGIISAGFVEQYDKLKQMELYAEERELKFVTSCVGSNHQWCGKEIRNLVFPPELLLVMIIRRSEVIVPKGNTEILANDTLVFGAKHYKSPVKVDLREIIVKDENPWVGKPIKDLDFSRQEMIVMIHRNGKSIIPNGSTVIHEDDSVIMYSRHGKRTEID